MPGVPGKGSMIMIIVAARAAPASRSLFRVIGDFDFTRTSTRQVVFVPGMFASIEPCAGEGPAVKGELTNPCALVVPVTVEAFPNEPILPTTVNVRGKSGTGLSFASVT